MFLGPNGIGPWEWEELAVALDRAAKDRTFRVFPVLLPALPDPFDPSMLPPFLSTRTWIDLRNEAEGRGAVQELINAVNGVAPGAPPAGAPMVTVCPYLGLQAFDEERAMFFFGRAREVQEMVERRNRACRRCGGPASVRLRDRAGRPQLVSAPNRLFPQ